MDICSQVINYYGKDLEPFVTKTCIQIYRSHANGDNFNKVKDAI